jgi:hypothetical protein
MQFCRGKRDLVLSSSLPRTSENLQDHASFGPSHFLDNQKRSAIHVSLCTPCNEKSVYMDSLLRMLLEAPFVLFLRLLHRT